MNEIYSSHFTAKTLTVKKSKNATDVSPHAYCCVLANIAIPINYMIAESASTTDKLAIAIALRTQYQQSRGVLQANYPSSTRWTPPSIPQRSVQKDNPNLTQKSPDSRGPSKANYLSPKRWTPH